MCHVLSFGPRVIIMTITFHHKNLLFILFGPESMESLLNMIFNHFISIYIFTFSSETGQQDEDDDDDNDNATTSIHSFAGELLI